VNFLQPTAAATDPLRDNPNELKITFDAATVELLSKLMQGPDQRYRCSAAFQVRPVLIVPAEPLRTRNWSGSITPPPGP